MAVEGYLLTPVGDDEEIARLIYTPSMIEDDCVSFGAFILGRLKSGKDEEYLSVWRTKYRLPTKKKAKKVKPRQPGDVLYGYASLTVGDVHGIENDSCVAMVLNKDKDTEQYHVGIYYTLNGIPLNGASEDPDFLMLAMDLAAISTTHSFS